MCADLLVGIDAKYLAQSLDRIGLSLRFVDLVGAGVLYVLGRQAVDDPRGDGGSVPG